jgi:2-aminoadipate transaminase
VSRAIHRSKTDLSASSGPIVAEIEAEARPQAPIERALAGWIATRSRSVLREMVTLVARPGILSLAGGLPDMALFPQAAYARALAEVLAADPRALQYQPSFAPLRDQVVELMRLRGVECSAESVLFVTGAQQGIDLCARLFVEDRSVVVHEALTYTGFQQAIAPFRPEIVAVPSHREHGFDVEALAEQLASGLRPRLIYVVPDGHNPLGVSLSLSRRQRLVELARHYQVPILEDDPYGLLAYDGDFAPPLRALDEDWVIYVGSFSKILAPGLRLGWLVMPPRLIPKVTIVKEASDLECSALTQRAVQGYLSQGDFPAHLARLRAAYRARRDALLGALEGHFAGSATWTRPRGGMFVWVDLDLARLGALAGDTAELLRRAVDEQGVAFVPGVAFAAPVGTRGRESGTSSLRLSFSSLSPDQIEQAVARLASLFTN